VRGHGAHTDIVMASAMANLDALNRYCYRAGARGEAAREVGP
jgi:hypothetical protein